MKGQKGGIPSIDSSDIHKLDLLGHELGNALNGLLGMVELLGESELDTQQDRWLRAIAQSGSHMQSLIRSFRFFREETGLDFVPRAVGVDGVELLEQVIISHTPAAVSGNNRLMLVTGPAVPRRWRCDPCLVRQLLDNLVGNALKFTRDGEVVLEADTLPGETDAGRTLLFRIIDNGPGIGAGVESRISEAGIPGRSRAQEGPGNRGLGLLISRYIVQSMRGSMSWDRNAGGGTSFEIQLPGALLLREPGSPLPGSSLLAQFRVRLQLDRSSRRSVQSILDRLGVTRRSGRVEESAKEDGALDLIISEASGLHGGNSPCLILTPRPASGRAPCSRRLEAPVLESTLGLLLFEIALEWRSIEIRNGKPGSTPTRR